jgi:hypothetical protein
VPQRVLANAAHAAKLDAIHAGRSFPSLAPMASSWRTAEERNALILRQLAAAGIEQ